MMNDMARLNAVSHNLANSTTTGFKKEILVTRPFLEFLGTAQSDGLTGVLPIGLPRSESVTDHRPGTLKFTGNPLDMAVVDDGFFEIMTEQGPAYTRKGNFRLDVQGRLVTDSGMPVMGLSGELQLTTPQPVIDANGKIFEGERQVGQVKLVKFTDPASLEAAGTGMYRAGPASVVKTEGLDRIRQGYTEASNVNSMTEMVKMIETMRHFESGQKVIQSYNDMLEKAIRTLGEF
jgi:flagellar basal-body rod protein FlgG